MFEISEQLILEQSDEIFGVTPISWESSPWKHLSRVSDEEVISLSHGKVYVFSDSVLCLGKMNQNPTPNSALEEKLSWFKSSSQHRTLDTSDRVANGIRVEYLPRIHHVAALQQKSMSSCLKWAVHQKFKGRNIFMSMFNDILWRSDDNERECNANADLVSLFAKKKKQQDFGHSLDLDRRRSGIPFTLTDHKENGTELRNR